MPSDKFALARERASPERASDVEASLPRNTRGGGSEPSTSRGSNPFRFVLLFRSRATRSHHALTLFFSFTLRSGSSIQCAWGSRFSFFFLFRATTTAPQHTDDDRGSANATLRDAPQPTGTVSRIPAYYSGYRSNARAEPSPPRSHLESPRTINRRRDIYHPADAQTFLDQSATTRDFRMQHPIPL